MTPVVLRIHCLRCNTLLATARPDEPAPTLTHRGRWEQVSPPDAPDERWKWTCPNPECRRTRELRTDRIVANLEDMARRGVRGADI